MSSYTAAERALAYWLLRQWLTRARAEAGDAVMTWYPVPGVAMTNRSEHRPTLTAGQIIRAEIQSRRLSRILSRQHELIRVFSSVPPLRSHDYIVSR